MGRQHRYWHPGFFFHVTMRGNNRQPIFKEPRDMAELFRVLSYAYDLYRFEIVAYCMMTNHYHLVIRSPNVPLSKVMMIVNKRYTDYYRRKYRFSGQLYEKRYYSEVIEDALGLVEVSRYVHRNPIETKIPMVQRMEDYPYSSYRFYKTGQSTILPFLNLALLPSLFKTPPQQTLAYLCQFTEQNEKDKTASLHACIAQLKTER